MDWCILYVRVYIPACDTVRQDKTLIEPREANLCLRAFRHDKFQLRMPSHSEGPGIWLSVWMLLLTHCLYERAAKVLARLRGCAGSPEPSLLAYAISTKFAWRGPIKLLNLNYNWVWVPFDRKFPLFWYRSFDCSIFWYQSENRYN